MRRFLVLFFVAFLGLLIFASEHAIALEGVRNVKKVISGGMYRGGGPGGMRPLSTSALKSLCKEGFSKAIYLYSKGFTGPQTVDCRMSNGQPNRLRYESVSFRTGRRAILEDVHSALMNNRGPVFVHCWNGKHAAGEIAAIALRQFCDYSGSQAASYWKKNIDDDPNNFTSIWKKHIPNFQPHSDLKLSSSLQNQVCP